MYVVDSKLYSSVLLYVCSIPYETAVLDCCIKKKFDMKYCIAKYWQQNGNCPPSFPPPPLQREEKGAGNSWGGGRGAT